MSERIRNAHMQDAFHGAGSHGHGRCKRIGNSLCHRYDHRTEAVPKSQRAEEPLPRMVNDRNENETL